MPSVRLELTTFRLWDWRANQLRQEGNCPKRLIIGTRTKIEGKIESK